MPELNFSTFTISRPNKRDEEVTVTTGLRLKTLDLIKRIRALEFSDEILEALAEPGNTPIKEYVNHHLVPYGFELETPREELLKRIRTIKTFLDENASEIAEQYRDCAWAISDIFVLINDILTEEGEA